MNLSGIHGGLTPRIGVASTRRSPAQTTADERMREAHSGEQRVSGGHYAPAPSGLWDSETTIFFADTPLRCTSSAA